MTETTAQIRIRHAAEMSAHKANADDAPRIAGTFHHDTAKAARVAEVSRGWDALEWWRVNVQSRAALAQEGAGAHHRQLVQVERT